MPGKRKATKTVKTLREESAALRAVAAMIDAAADELEARKQKSIAFDGAFGIDRGIKTSHGYALKLTAAVAGLRPISDLGK